MKVISSDNYYYNDASYELEMNLQKKRQELIAMLDSEDEGCLICHQLKCRCTIAENGTQIDTDKPTNKTEEEPAPPTPEKDIINGDVEAWIQSCKVINILKNSSALETFLGFGMRRVKTGL